MRKRLSRKFYLQPTLEIARALLGKHIIRQVGKKKIVGKIVETEAYIGPGDLASHAKGGKITARNLAEYMVGGHIYIYLVYGMYWQLNISTGKSGQPECVLIRAVEPPGLASRHDLTNGPGKLCRYLKLNKQHYGIDLVKSKKLWLEGGEKIPPSKIVASRRIGIDYAGRYWANKKWRFYIKDNSYVSKK